jgi:hypothetical protein
VHGLYDHHPSIHADNPARLLQDQFDQPCVFAPTLGPETSEWSGLYRSQVDNRSFRFGNDFLRDDDDGALRQ